MLYIYIFTYVCYVYIYIYILMYIQIMLHIYIYIMFYIYRERERYVSHQFYGFFIFPHHSPFRTFALLGSAWTTLSASPSSPWRGSARRSRPRTTRQFLGGGDHPRLMVGRQRENHGESWEFMGVYTIYHQTNMFLKSKQTPLFFNQPMGIWDIYGYKIIYEISRLNGGS